MSAVNVKALEAAHPFTSVEHTQYTLISCDEFHALIAALRIAVEALREIGGWDDTWSHRGHEPSEVGHECRMCWIMKAKSHALAAIEKEVTL